MGAQNAEKMNYRMEYAQGQMMLYNVGIKLASLFPRASTNAVIQLIYSCLTRNIVSTNSIAPCSVYKPYTTHNSAICSDEGLTLETSALQSLYGGQFTLSTLLINQINVGIGVGKTVDLHGQGKVPRPER